VSWQMVGDATRLVKLVSNWTLWGGVRGVDGGLDCDWLIAVGLRCGFRGPSTVIT